MFATGSRSAPMRPARAFAMFGSVALHAAVVYAASRTQLPAPTTNELATRVVWIERMRVEPRMLPTAVLPAEPPAIVEPEPSSERETERVPEAPPQAETRRDEAERAPAEGPVAEDRPRRSYLAPSVDLETERQRAVARVLEDLERERTFSTREPTQEGASVPNPREHLFDPPSRGSQRSVLSPSQARSHFARKLGELCNALTGGFGVAFQGFGLFQACAEPGAPADFFADVRSDAMNSLPECAEPENLPALAIARRDEIPTIKCRLVLKEEP